MMDKSGNNGDEGVIDVDAIRYGFGRNDDFPGISDSDADSIDPESRGKWGETTALAMGGSIVGMIALLVLNWATLFVSDPRVLLAINTLFAGIAVLVAMAVVVSQPPD